MGGKGVSSNCGDIWIDGDFLLGGLAVLGIAAAFILNQAITMGKKKRRRKKRAAELQLDSDNLWALGNTVILLKINRQKIRTDQHSFCRQ